MSRLDDQFAFALALPRLLDYIHNMGYDYTLGDAYRDPRVHGEFGVKKSYSASRSYHKLRLAIDLNLFKDGAYLIDTNDYEKIGRFWESLGGSWGGRFEDGNHFSWGESS